MSYTSSIPKSGESLGSTRARINTNFQEIAAVEAINHIAFNLTGKGKHKFLQMPETNSISPGTPPATAINEAGFYAKVGTNPAETNLFFRAENSGKEYQLTTADSARLSSFSTKAGVENSGWTFLPGGMLMQYGLRTIGSKGNTTTITYPKPFVTGVYSVTIGNVTSETSPSPNNQFVKDGTVGLTTFQVVNSSSSSSNKVYWMAIGV